MSLNDLVRSVFDGIREAKEETYYHRKFRELPQSPLFGVDELEDMVNHATSKEHYNLILDHLYRFDATESPYGYYKGIERKIIERVWPK